MTIDSPVLNGVRVFGSSTLRVAPDTATISIAVSRVEQLPKDAFASAHLTAAAVLRFLTTHKAGEFGSSRITLSQEIRFIQSEQRFMGYKARVGYTITLRDLGRLEEVLTGAISAGANELTSVQFETTELKKLRAEARKAAVAAAREKAELYCHEARVALGRVMAIEDVNPDQLSLSNVRSSHSLIGGAGVGNDKAIDPAMITVGASVYLTFAIADLP